MKKPSSLEWMTTLVSLHYSKKNENTYSGFASDLYFSLWNSSSKSANSIGEANRRREFSRSAGSSRLVAECDDL